MADVSNWEQVLGERILRADRMRRRLLPSETDTYRVVNGAGDGLPGFVLDRYGELAVLRVYAKAWEHHLDWLVAACRKCWGGSAPSIGDLASATWTVERVGRHCLARPCGSNGGFRARHAYVGSSICRTEDRAVS